MDRLWFAFSNPAAQTEAMIEEYLQRTKTAVWIEHDCAANAKLKNAPAYHE
ncbi:MAG: hypothetical protein ABI640_21660 [Gammaproteobacteria bacterium]